MRYFDYLKSVLCAPDKYVNLLEIFHKEIFYVNKELPTAEMDENRIADGLALRDEYAAHGYDPHTDLLAIDYELPTTPNGTCTFLEFFAALARRMENDILYDPIKGNRTWEWAEHMISNMGLGRREFLNPINPRAYYEVQRAMFRVIDRTYEPSGEGGLFWIKCSIKYVGLDLRGLEIWDQMKYYIRENRLV